MTRFLHITDLHISMREGEARTQSRLDRLVAVANQMTPRPAFILASGDLTDHGDDESYLWLAERLAGLSIPIVWALGNHDKRAGFHRAFQGYDGAPDGALDHDVVHAGLHIIALDSAVPGRVGGALDPAQITRLRAALARHADLPKLIVVHHPPKLSEGIGWEALDEASTAALAEAIRGHDVRGIFSGHIHLNRMSLWQGVPVVIAQGQQNTNDPAVQNELVILDGASFGLCTLRESGLDVVFAPLDDREVLRRIPLDVLHSFE